MCPVVIIGGNVKIPWNPRELIAEPIKQANTVAVIALCVGLLALGVAIMNGVKNAH